MSERIHHLIIEFVDHIYCRSLARLVCALHYQKVEIQVFREQYQAPHLLHRANHRACQHLSHIAKQLSKVWEEYQQWFSATLTLRTIKA